MYPLNKGNLNFVEYALSVRKNHLSYAVLPNQKNIFQMYSDKRIVAMLQKRDRRGLAWLFDKYGSNLYGLAIAIVGDQEQAAELVRSSIGAWMRQSNFGEQRLLYQLLYVVRKNALEYKEGMHSENEQVQSQLERMDVLDFYFLNGVENKRNIRNSETLGQELRSAFRNLRNQIEGRTGFGK